MFFHVCRGKQKKLKISGAGTQARNQSQKQHAETDHDIRPSYTNILETGVSGKNKRLFLESLHSFLDKNSVKERAPFPRVYTSLVAFLCGNEQ